MATRSAAMQMRDSFGDRKLPDISRKITACVACRKLKARSPIKCHIDDLGQPCRRCRSRDLSCTVNKSLQMLLESDASFKERTEQRLDDLERRLPKSGTSTKLNNTSFATEAMPPPPASFTSPTTTALETTSPGLNLSCSLGAFPASSMTTPQAGSSSNTQDTARDLIERGVVTVEAAKGHLAYFREHLDIFLHHECATVDSLAVLRSRSSFMTAAVCTVSAYCQNLQCYQACLEAYMAEASLKLFSTKYIFDDVRALLIGALWLGHISPSLAGQAVRISSQLDLHRCITKMPHSKSECYERTRLYFLVCCVDHQCSLMYGRPPMTYEWQSVKHPRVFLDSPLARRTDDDLVSQLELWAIGRSVFLNFGADVESGVANNQRDVLAGTSGAYDLWSSRLAGANSTQSYRLGPWSHLSGLYLHSAKLHLFSHTFRGPAQPLVESGITVRTNDVGSMAVESAIATLISVCEGQASQHWLLTLPHYFVTTIAFACVVLIKVCSPYHDNGEDRQLDCHTTLRSLQATLQDCLPAHSSHPLSGISRGLEAALPDVQPSAGDIDPSSEFELTSGNGNIDLDIFLGDPAMWSLPGFDDQWLHCPDDITH